MTDAQELEIENLLPEFAAIGPLDLGEDNRARPAYEQKMRQHLAPDALTGWKIVLDTANGATVHTSATVLRALGAELIQIGSTPDGVNINAEVGSEHPDKMAAAVVKHGARLGIAHDGDGDRCIFCDETGAVLDGDEVLTLLAVDGIKHGDLAQSTLVITVQSNLGVDAAVKAAGGRVLRTDVGDRYVGEAMRKHGASLGGESSGHLICPRMGPSGDGLGAALLVLQVMQRTEQPLSVLRKGLVKFPQQTGALKVAKKIPLPDCPALTAQILALESELGEQGRVLVRYSGTEAKLRLLIEGPDDATVADGYTRLRDAAAADLEIV